MDSDPVRGLNNFLQGRKDARGGNLTQQFSWLLWQEGPDHQKVHYATAKLHGQVIGTGSGISVGTAKHGAASQGLQYLRSLPPKHPMISPR